MRPFCRKNHVHKIPRFRGGGGYFGFFGGGSADLIFMGARIFLIEARKLGKPLTSTLLTSTLFLAPGGFPVEGFELKWSFMRTSLKGFPGTSHEKRVPGAPFKGIERVRGAPPGTKNQAGHVKSGLWWPPEKATQTPEIPTNGAFTRTSQKVRANFCLSPATQVRNPTEIVQKNLFRRTL